ncbi:MAG: UvrD-helicase domain-containing protein [candidate division WOR-3 bacterium]
MDKGKIILSPDFWVILSAPAGSGKTEWLSKRFLEIIKRENINPLKILAITFTEKAAGEMKMRILNMAKNSYPEIYKKYEEEFMMLRISTIHSFCTNFLRRFAYEIGVPLGFEILDAPAAKIYFDEKVDEFILERIFKKKKEYEWILSASAFFKWERFIDFLENFFNKRPLSDNLFYKISKPEEIVKFIPFEFENLKENLEKIKKHIENFELPDYDILIENPEEVYKIIKIIKRIENRIEDKELFRKFKNNIYTLFFFHFTFYISLFFKEILEYYFKMKSYEAKVDFPDMEFFTYQILNEGKIEEIDNLLEAFDERTSHILVDEFQDTNFLQWKIIEKLTEEWRSGFGAKFERGENTSLFIVGDPMQSIYMFRNANVKTFKKAKDDIILWMGEKAKEENLTENYRSLISIIDFVNKIFSNGREIDYVPFAKKRNNEEKGFVEIIINEENNVEKEIRAIARRIKNLIGEEIVYEKGSEKKKRCEYKDIAILLRKRTHLNLYEKILKEENIPYCIVGGLGFWDEPEIYFLSNFVEFLSEPSYNYGLYLILKTLYKLEENEILKLKLKGKNLFDSLSLNIKKEIEDLRKGIREKGLTKSLIDYLFKKEFFKYIGSDIQKVKNVFKFFKIIFELEKTRGNISAIASFLRKIRENKDEPRANIFSEDMNAVRILTIHKAKGLEFCIVFIPELHEIKIRKKDELIFEEDETGYSFKIYPFEKGKIESKFYKEYIKKLDEENKRILYVALTRARDGLILSGKFNFKKTPDPSKNAFQYVLYHAGIYKEGERYNTRLKFENLRILKCEEIEGKEIKEVERIKKERIDFERKIYLPEKILYSSFSHYYSQIFGEIMHKIFDAISKGILKEENIEIFINNLISQTKILEEIKEKIFEEIYLQIKTLKENKIWENIILPKENSFSEIEFIYKEDGEIKKGRIDRLILKEDFAEIYDYKISFKKQDERTKEKITKESIPQIKLYKEAVKEFFGIEKIKGYLIFTKEGEIREID